jgi:hypothetical protein
MIRLIDAHSQGYLGQVRELFQEYAASLEVDLCFQNFQSEMAGLPGDYAPPQGHGLTVRSCTPSNDGPGGLRWSTPRRYRGPIADY